MPTYVVITVLFAAALHASWNALVKGGTDRFLDTAGLLLGSVMLAAVCMPFLKFPARASWPYLAASGVVHLAYFALIAACYQTGEMSVVYPVMRGAAPALAALGSVLALREHPTPAGWAGVLLVSAGVVTFACESRAKAGLHARAVALALLNALVIAIYTVIDAAGVRLSHSPLSYTFCGVGICAAGFVPAALKARGAEARAHFKAGWPRGVLGGGCSIAAYSLALWAMTLAPVASVAALRESAIGFGLILSASRLKERITPVRMAACLLVLACVIVIKLA